MLPPNSIFWWIGNHEAIPEGFGRVTSLDGKFVKAALTGILDTGGNANHTHTNSHTHVVAPHVHPVNLGTPTDTNSRAGEAGSNLGTIGHTHPNSTTGTSGSEESSSASVTFSTADNLPPFFEVIFLTNGDAWKMLPTDSLVYRTTASRKGAVIHEESEGRFLRGAAASQNSGAIGGSPTHQHTQTHTHTASPHSHVTGTTVQANEKKVKQGTEIYHPTVAQPDHGHAITVGAATQNMNPNSDPTAPVNSEPSHKTLTPFKLLTTQSCVVGDIVLTAESSTPVGWADCDGEGGTPNLTGLYVKSSVTPNVAGGSNTHSHDFTHGHTGSGAHSHPHDSKTGYSGAGTGNEAGGGAQSTTDHRHWFTSVSSVIADYAQVTTATDEVSNEPPYIKLRYIIMKFDALGSSPAVLAVENL